MIEEDHLHLIEKETVQEKSLVVQRTFNVPASEKRLSIQTKKFLFAR